MSLISLTLFSLLFKEIARNCLEISLKIPPVYFKDFKKKRNVLEEICISKSRNSNGQCCCDISDQQVLHAFFCFQMQAST